MSTESLNRTSDVIGTPSQSIETPRVNVDVLKQRLIEQKKKERALKYKTNTKPPIHTSATINLTNAPAKSIINRNKLLNLSTNINNLANNFKKNRNLENEVLKQKHYFV